jgi:hypothetical protein
MNWTPADSTKLAHLLSTSPLISALEENPPSLDGATLEERAMAASERHGFESCIERVIQLATATTKAQEPSPYVQGIDSFEQPAPPKE